MRGSREISLVPSLHRASTDALIARLSRRVWRRFVRGSREISLLPSLHRASTDALIKTLV